MPLDEIGRRYADSIYQRRLHDISGNEEQEINRLRNQHASRGSILSGSYIHDHFKLLLERVDILAQAKSDGLVRAYEKSGLPFDEAAFQDVKGDVVSFCQSQQHDLIGSMTQVVRQTFGANTPAGTFDALSKQIVSQMGAMISRLVSDLAIKRDEKILDDLKTNQVYTAADRKFARLAIEEARKSVPENDGRPHPWVGAVVVKDGKVLGTAHRGEVPGNHAEFVALERNLPDVAVAGATVYTTLEPCTTRNPPKIPCVDRLIERRVARVVIGILDPDDRIRGKGQRKLSNAGIETSLFPHDLALEVEELNREFTRFCEQNVRTEVGPANMELWKEVAGLRTEFAEFRQNVEARDKERAEFEHFPVNFSLNQGAPGSYIGLLKNDSKYKVVIETIQIFRGDADHESPLTEAVKPRPTDDWKVEPGTSKTLYWGPQYEPIAMLKSLVLSPDPNFPNGRIIPIALVLMLNVEGKRLPKKYTQQVLMQGHQITPWGP